MPADLTLTSLKCNVKYEETQPAVCASSGFRKSGTGTATAYLLHIALTGASLDAALSDSEGAGDASAPLADFATRLAQFIGMGEFELVETSPWHAGSPPLGGTTSRLTSQTFPIQIVRDLIPDA